jgi:hypothetical protein
VYSMLVFTLTRCVVSYVTQEGKNPEADVAKDS